MRTAGWPPIGRPAASFECEGVPVAVGDSRVAKSGSGRAPDGSVRQRSGTRPPPWDPRVAGQRGSGASRGDPSGQLQPARRFTLTGLGAVAFVFVITLALASLESLLGIGLRIATLVALSGSTLLAGLWVRRSDLGTIVVAPPLVFALVAALEIMLAPTLSFTPTVFAAILVRGFPTMIIATAIAVMVCGYRIVRHR